MDLRASECAAFLRENDGYLIVSHRRPDGDTLGSGAALCSALRRAGRRARCFDNPETISLHRPFVEPYVSGDGRDYSTLVTVDVASEGLFPDGVTGPVPLAVDHHPGRTHPLHQRPHRQRINRMNSFRVASSRRKEPSMELVVITECCFSTPRICMHRCRASITTPTPSAPTVSMIACDTCRVSRS